MSQVTSLPAINPLWNYSDPAATEAKFRELLPQAEASDDVNYHAELLTQIARTYSLRGTFTEAHALLDTVANMIASNPEALRVAEVRYLLERGRTFNSNNEQEKALPLFERAFHKAAEIGENGYAIDAVHMIAIAESDPHKQIEWNLKGIAMAENDAKWRGWLWALYNNIAESYAKIEDYMKALRYFHRLADFQKEKTGSVDLYTTKDIARIERLSGHPDRSAVIMAPIVEESIAAGTDDGWFRAEFAEALHALGKPQEAKPHFIKAYELLSSDDYCIRHEQSLLSRLKEMAE